MPAIGLETARNRLKMLLGPVRYLSFGAVEAGQIDGEADGRQFHYVSYYRHRIGNHFRRIGDHDFILDNHFLKSHAYNLALVHLHYRAADAGMRDAALRHNYKKFFAECVLDTSNCLIGRALLIETLAYEQDLMEGLFADIAADPHLQQRADDLAALMSRLLSQHELAHYFMHRTGGAFLGEAASFFDGALIEAHAALAAEAGAAAAEELLCDGVSAWLAIGDEAMAASGYDRITRIRMIAFGFLCFADLVSLQKSAAVTAQNSAADDATIQLGSEIRNKVAFGFAVGRDAAMDRRVAAMIVLLEAAAERSGCPLYGSAGPFPFERSTAQDLRNAFEHFADEAPAAPVALGGTDLRRRGFAQLLAESLHDHDRGAEHLLWRSKRFIVAGEHIDP